MSILYKKYQNINFSGRSFTWQLPAAAAGGRRENGGVCL